jgi:hypothetical protein
MTAIRIVLGTLFMLVAGCFVFAQSNFSGNAEVLLEFSPSNPSMADGQIEVRVLADVSAVKTGGGAAAQLTSYSMPVGFDPSFVRLISATAGESLGFASTGFAYTLPALANGKGFVTIINMQARPQDPGGRVELARLAFELKRPGNAIFIAGSARTIHEGTLAAIPSDTGSPAQRISWADHIYSVRIGAGASLPSLLCPSWISMPDAFQGMAILNEGADRASIRMLGYRPDGTLAKAAQSIDLSGLNQDARTADQIFGNSDPMLIDGGWIEIQADTPDISGFFLQGSVTDSGTRQDGVQLTYDTASRLIFPLVRDPARNNEVSLVNPGNSPVDVQMSIRGTSGQLLRSIAGQVPAHGTFIRKITDATSNAPVYVDVRATGGKLVGVQRSGTDASLAALSGQDPEMASNRLSAPQFASGFLGGSLRIDTHLALVNPGPATTVILRLVNDTGSEIAAPVVYPLASQALLSIEGWKLFGLPDPSTTSSLTTGTVSIESDQPVVGALSFGDPVEGKYLAALPLMSTATARRQIFFGQVAVGPLGDVEYFTGLAMANPSKTETAKIHIELHGTDGSLKARTTTPFEIGPGGRSANLIEQLIPNFPESQFGGYLRLESSIEINAYMLIGDQYYNFLSAVP